MKNNIIITLSIAILLIIINPLMSQDNSKAEFIEDWETGDFSQYMWQFIGAADWNITDLDPYEGIYCAQSGTISHYEQSTVYHIYEVYSPQEISFWLKVSSEQDFDFLRFYIDGIEQGYWSGEIPWQEVSFPVTAGIHSFKWEYDKDANLSGGSDACWIDYITFPPVAIEALFYADSADICKNEDVYFFDQSIGPVTQWNWTFEGGVPTSSTEQNPIVTYPAAGEWDVYLEVSDGLEASQLLKSNYINIVDVPPPPPALTGISYVCANWVSTSYSTTGLAGITEYNWMIAPPEAGSISGSGTNVTVVWEETFLGDADLQVAGINYCGIGTYSDPLTITRYLPDVSLMLPAFVSISTPPFVLTGGLPLGGEYSGPGVANGFFDPAEAGLGMHTIAYSYTDINTCAGVALDSIGVTEYTGLSNQYSQNNINIFPNPNNGSFQIEFTPNEFDIITFKLFNSVNELVWELPNVSVYNKYTQMVQLDNNLVGVFFMQIIGQKVFSSHKIILK